MIMPDCSGGRKGSARILWSPFSALNRDVGGSHHYPTLGKSNVAGWKISEINKGYRWERHLFKWRIFPASHVWLPECSSQTETQPVLRFHQSEHSQRRHGWRHGAVITICPNRFLQVWVEFQDSGRYKSDPYHIIWCLIVGHIFHFHLFWETKFL